MTVFQGEILCRVKDSGKAVDGFFVLGASELDFQSIHPVGK